MATLKLVLWNNPTRKFTFLNLPSGIPAAVLNSMLLFTFRKNIKFIYLFLFQIIMAKPAGGPKPPPGNKDFDDDDWT